MKMLKDCELEIGDIIVLEDGRQYTCLPIMNLGLVNLYRFSFRNISQETVYICPDLMVKEIIKKDPKKQILQKIEQHKSEIEILENQLKELNSLKVGEVYRVKSPFTYNGVFGHYNFDKDELLYLISKTNIDSFCSNIMNRRINVENNVLKDYLELVNDPEMKNGLAKFFKGNSE